MPNFKKRPSQKIHINKESFDLSSGKFKEHFGDIKNSKTARYIRRRTEQHAKDRAASERYTEFSRMAKQKPKLRDADAPKTLQEKGTETVSKVVKYVKGHKKPRDERAVRHINPKHLLWILAAVCLILIILSGVNEKIRRPFMDAASVIVVPVQKGVNSIGLWLSDKLEAQKTLEALEQENQDLKNQVESLNMSLTMLHQKELELERLQELFKIQDQYSAYDMVAAHVISKDSGKWFSTFTIDKGTNDGITRDMNVLASGGLVGIVIETGPGFSTVRSIIDDESFVSAQFEDTSELCMLNGSLTLMEQNLLEFRDVSADVMISMNSALLTSHVSSRYLPGLLIGYVVDYQLDANDLTQSGHIKPVVDFADLQEVLIITKTKQTSD
ncbi:MAG: rod shape-determining protein MreC [Parasporobacterium sp.]|nr:rod shape-determining protein MreC [Parasporobacterium sp.]